MTFKQVLYSDLVIAGTMLKTPAYEMVEVLARSGLDFLAIDGEHAPFDRARLDSCLAIGRALEVAMLVRVVEGTQAELLKVLDSGATGVIVPHVDSVEKARDISAWARFGEGGRGYAGSTRWAGFATRKMPDVLEQSKTETVVIAQIEEPQGVEQIEKIAAVEGIDALFVGPADLAVCFGETDMNAQPVLDAMRHVAGVAKANGKRCLTFVADVSAIPDLRQMGVSGFFVGSEHKFILDGAKSVANEVVSLNRR